jgi:hypothetical protein
MWGGFFLLCSTLAVAAFLVSHTLSRTLRRLGFSFGFLLSALAIPISLMAAFEAVMCSSETTGQGVLSERGLVWSIERQGCGATTAGIYNVRVGPHAWWNHTILMSDAFPVPRSVEAAGEGAVGVIIDPDSAGENVPAEGLIVPIAASGKPDKLLSFERGVVQ